MNPADKKQQANTLRLQALALLEQATAIDGLKPYRVTHANGFGTAEYLGGFDHEPSAEEAAAFFELNFEPDRDEVLTIRLTSWEAILGIKKL
ncbi:hypothetical protein [Paraburkholderia youngii]|uniref:hypothetical protein n=1 Tax=Paraburkholderia youngii TaxID=2782701 RepID=UPI003D1D0EC2